jgi:hypothetical protein
MMINAAVIQSFILLQYTAGPEGFTRSAALPPRKITNCAKRTEGLSAADVPGYRRSCALIDEWLLTSRGRAAQAAAYCPVIWQRLLRPSTRE